MMKRSVRILCALLCVLMLLPLVGCSYEPQAVDIALVENGEAKLYIQLPADTPAQILYAKDRLLFYVREKTGATLACGTDAPAAGTACLMLGAVAHEMCTELAEEQEAGKFHIRAAEKNIAILADNDAFLYDAIEHLIEKMTYDAATNTLRLSGVLDVAMAGDTTSLRYMFTQSKTVGSESTLHGYLPFLPGADGVLGTSDDIKGTQGGCIVGNYQYQCIIKTDKESNQMNNLTYVVKYDLTTKQTVLCSELLQLNHANDITYNEKTGELVIVHNAPRGKMLTFMNPETLQVTRTGTLPVSVYAITYNKARDQYMLGISGGQNLRPVTADLQYATEKITQATPTTKNYTTQGICSDDTFIYCALYDSIYVQSSRMQNVITVYDWYGNYVGLINIGVGNLEPENVSITNGNITVLAYKSGKGGAIYNITLTGPVTEDKKKS